MSHALRKITGSVNKSKTCLIFINQLRMKIGGYGNPETTTGGMALKFYSSVRIEVRRGEAMKEKENIYGYMTKIKVAKNKLAAPFKTAEFAVLFDRGPYNISCILDEAVKLEIIRRSGTWFYYGEDKLGQGRENSYQYLEANPETCKKIELLIREKNDLPIEEEKLNESLVEEKKEEKKKKKPAAKKVEQEEELL